MWGTRSVNQYDSLPHYSPVTFTWQEDTQFSWATHSASICDLQEVCMYVCIEARQDGMSNNTNPVPTEILVGSLDF
jgi:hypothetical protein